MAGEQTGARCVSERVPLSFGGGQLGHIHSGQEPEDRQVVPDRRRRENCLRESPQGRQLGS